MRDKEYRHGLVNAQIEVDLPLQLRALRKQQALTQPQLADLAEMKQSRISKMEKPGGAHFTLETLKRLAKALDVALIVRFAPFSELVRWSQDFDPDSFGVPKFDDDLGFVERKPIQQQDQTARRVPVLQVGATTGTALPIDATSRHDQRDAKIRPELSAGRIAYMPSVIALRSVPTEQRMHA